MSFGLLSVHSMYKELFDILLASFFHYNKFDSATIASANVCGVAVGRMSIKLK